MKISKLFALLLLTMLMISCEDDDDASASFNLNTTNLAGTYRLTSFEGDSRETDTFMGNTEVTTSTFIASDFNNATSTFTANGTLTSAGSLTLTTIFSEDNETFTEVETDTFDLEGTFRLEGNNLIFSDEDQLTVTIRNFNEAGFEMVINDIDIDTDDSFEINAVLRYERN